MRGLALPRTLAGFTARRPVRLSLTPRMRRRLAVAVAAVAALTALYHLWLRDSSLVAVTSVEVTGLTTKDGDRIAAALATAAEDMTTLHIRHDELKELASQFPVIGSIRVERDFPHGLRIAVTERRPAAIVSVEGAAVPVAGDGTVLEGLQTADTLPVLRTDEPISDDRVTDARTLRALLVAGAAPPPLLARAERITESADRGIVVPLDEGPEIVFGDADLAAEKWAAATRVLADPAAQGASYIDVRLPERPVAGGLPVETVEPVAPAGEVVTPEAVVPVDPAAVPTDPAVVPTDPAAAAPVDPAAQVAPAPAPEAAPPATAAPAPAGATGGVTSPQP